MPAINPSADFQKEKSDFAFMSHEHSGTPKDKLNLYRHIKEGLDDVCNGNIRPLSAAMQDIRSKRKK